MTDFKLSLELAIEFCKQEYIAVDAICSHQDMGVHAVTALDIREYEATGFVLEHFA